MTQGNRGFTLVELMIVIGIITIIAAIALPNILAARISANETAAIGALKTIHTSQALFKDRDKESDGNLDYGTLGELGSTQLIDSILRTGTKSGYQFESGPVTTNLQTRKTLFWSIANPAVLGASGNRSFASNHHGVIFYTSQVLAPATNLKNTAVIPPGMISVR